jgi:hypothetical protein
MGEGYMEPISPIGARRAKQSDGDFNFFRIYNGLEGNFIRVK